MFNSFLSAVAGDQEAEEQEGQQEAEGAQGSSSQGGMFSFVTMAKDLASTVQKQSEEIAKSVTATDWKKEIEDFGQAIKEDTKTVMAEAGSMSFNAEQPGLAFADIQSNIRRENLEEMGEQIQDLGRNLLAGTAEIFNQVKTTVQSEMAAASEAQRRQGRAAGKRSGAGSAAAPSRQSQYESKVSAMQRDSSTYCDEPEDLDYFELWKGTFDLEAHKQEIAGILDGNAFMTELQNRIVPLIVDYETFWVQYFFRLHCIQVEEGMAKPKVEADVPAEAEAEVRPSDAEVQSEHLTQVEPASAVPTEAQVPVQADSESEADADAEADEGDGCDQENEASGQPAALYQNSPTKSDEPDAATASDSSASEWVAVKNRSTPSTPSAKDAEAASGGDAGPARVEREVESPVPASATASEVGKEENVGRGDGVQGGGKTPAPTGAALSVSPSPLTTPANVDMADDDIDEDWGEI